MAQQFVSDRAGQLFLMLTSAHMLLICRLSDRFFSLSKQDQHMSSSPPPRPGTAAQGKEEEEEGHGHYPVEGGGGAEGEVKRSTWRVQSSV